MLKQGGRKQVRRIATKNNERVNKESTNREAGKQHNNNETRKRIVNHNIENNAKTSGPGGNTQQRSREQRLKNDDETMKT